MPVDVVEIKWQRSSQTGRKSRLQYLPPAAMSIEFLVIFAQSHDNFRIPELLSVAELYKFAITFPESPEECDCKRPFMVLKLDEEEHARILASRCILIKYFHVYAIIDRKDSSYSLFFRSVYHYYASGSSYEELHERNRAAHSKWSRYAPDTSFKYVVDGYKHAIPQFRRKEIIETFSYMELLGRIDMKSPEVTFGCFEECASVGQVVTHLKTDFHQMRTSEEYQRLT